MNSFSEQCGAFSTDRTTTSECAEIAPGVLVKPFPNLRPLTSPRTRLRLPLSEAVPPRMLVCLSSDPP
jgi:hypothetical protein